MSVRWTQPIQQHGRRMPSFSSEQTRSTCSRRVSGAFTEITQQIHSLRASRVRVSHIAKALGSDRRALSRSFGRSCATPPEIALGIGFRSEELRRNVNPTGRRCVPIRRLLCLSYRSSSDVSQHEPMTMACYSSMKNAQNGTTRTRITMSHVLTYRCDDHDDRYETTRNYAGHSTYEWADGSAGPN